MSNFINSITIKNYRGFKDECVLEVANKKNMTILVGANNSGKSLITRIFSIFKSDLKASKNIYKIDDFQDIDFHNLDISNPVIFKFNINTDIFIDRDEPELIKLTRFKKDISINFEIRKIKDDFLCCISLSDENNSTHQFNDVKETFTFHSQNEITKNLEIDRLECERLCVLLYCEIKNRVLAFDAIRSFDRNTSGFYKNGSELIQWLYEQKSQSEIMMCKKQLREWLRTIFNLDDPSNVSADNEKKQLIFTFNDIQYSSDEIGTGYTMLYILLMEILRNKKEIIIIDEIESHLQPGLVRLLIQLIKSHGESQYIIATHSSSVLESATDGDMLYRFNKKDDICYFENFFRNKQGIGKFREVCNELGVVPGDAFLSNSVIWVEGPSEMFWLRAWLKTYLPIYKTRNRINCNLIEGLHFSILMTGGSSIAHYGFELDEIPVELIEEDEVLKVLKVNPNPFVIIDSDNADVNSKKFKRMVRIAKELREINKYNSKFSQSDNQSLAVDQFDNIPNLWVLNGRELENYAHPQLLKDFYEQRSSHRLSKITGVTDCTEWNVYSKSDGVGTILKQRGIEGVAKDSGTIIHKNDFSRYVFRNLQAIHFETAPSEIEKPNIEMLEELKKSLDKLISYLLKINNLMN